MNSPHPSTAWLPKLAAWFFWHSLYLVVVAATFLSLSLFPEFKVLFTGDVISNAWIESSIAVPLLLLLLLLPLFNILSLVESWKSGGWCSSCGDVVSSSLMKKRRTRIHSHQKVQWTLGHCFFENNIAKSSLLYLGCSGSDTTTLWRRRRRSSSSSTPFQSFFGPCRPFHPTHPPLTTETFSLKDLPQKKKTHTQLGCSVNGQMMIDEVAASVVPSSNLNFALNLIPQALLSGRLNPPPRSCCCCCCCNLSFFFCQIPWSPISPNSPKLTVLAALNQSKFSPLCNQCYNQIQFLPISPFTPKTPVSQSSNSASFPPYLPPSFFPLSFLSLLPLSLSLSLSLCAANKLLVCHKTHKTQKKNKKKTHTHTKITKNKITKSWSFFFVVVFPTFLFLHTLTHTHKTNKPNYWKPTKL